MRLPIVVMWLTAYVEVMSSRTADNRQSCSSPSQSSVPLNDARTNALHYTCLLHDQRSLLVSGGSLNWSFTVITSPTGAEVLKRVKQTK
jgi:hypothetical protein